MPAEIGYFEQLGQGQIDFKSALTTAGSGPLEELFDRSIDHLWMRDRAHVAKRVESYVLHLRKCGQPYASHAVS